MCNSLVLNGLAVLGIAALIGLMLYVFYKLADIVDDYRLIKDNLGYARRDVAELHKRLSNLEFKTFPNLESTVVRHTSALSHLDSWLLRTSLDNEKLDNRLKELEASKKNKTK